MNLVDLKWHLVRNRPDWMVFFLADTPTGPNNRSLFSGVFCVWVLRVQRAFFNRPDGSAGSVNKTYFLGVGMQRVISVYKTLVLRTLPGIIMHPPPPPKVRTSTEAHFRLAEHTRVSEIRVFIFKPVTSGLFRPFWFRTPPSTSATATIAASKHQELQELKHSQFFRGCSNTIKIF